MGRIEEAITQTGATAAAIRLNPKDFAALQKRGNVWSLKKDYDRAIADYDQVLRLKPKSVATLINRGNAWRAKKDYERAIADYTQAVRLNPQAALAWNNRAWLWATCPEEKYRNGRKAVEYARRACELTEWVNPNNLDTLAAACAEAKDFDGAVRWQEKTLELPALDEDVIERFRQRLKLYRERKPYRDT